MCEEEFQKKKATVFFRIIILYFPNQINCRNIDKKLYLKRKHEVERNILFCSK